MVDVFEMYSTLWLIAERLGAAVVYHGMMADGEGGFHPDPIETGQDAPTIFIGRPYYQEPSCEPSRLRNAGGRAQPAPDLPAELVTLPHECGHFLSWKERTPRESWLAYFDAVGARDRAWSGVVGSDDVQQFNDRLRATAQAALTPEQLNRILVEKEFAWVLGRELLEAVGFDDFAYYAERARKGLHFHRYRLGLDELWEDDAPPQEQAAQQAVEADGRASS
jgi:hypothetical protein